MIVYLVGQWVDRTALAAAKRPGWERIAYNRLATPDKDDVRVIKHFTDMIPIPGGTPIIRGLGFDDNPDKALFEAEVAAGRASFIADEKESPDAV